MVFGTIRNNESSKPNEITLPIRYKISQYLVYGICWST